VPYENRYLSEPKREKEKGLTLRVTLVAIKGEKEIEVFRPKKRETF